jgi:hypothetical protein
LAAGVTDLWREYGPQYARRARSISGRIHFLWQTGVGFWQKTVGNRRAILYRVLSLICF